jgi:beta-lactamase regulating signal transducer with metallopeptidase domain
MQHLPSAASNALIVNGDTPILALAGVWHPRLVISRRVLGALSHQQLGAAMRHEQSHRISRDNLKRLAFLLSPSVWPFGPRAKTLERAWARLSEWAADDDACAGDSRRSVALAEALVRVARLGVAARTSVLMTCLVPETGDLSARVNRLLNPQPPAPAPQTRRRLVAVTFALLGATLIVLIAEQSVTLHAVHALLERLSH